MRFRLLSFLGLIGCVAVTGCVRTNTELLDSSTAVISARGTAFDTPATVLKATVMQAAQLAQSHGFQYFKIISADDATRVSTMYTPGHTFTSGSVNGTVSGFGQFDGHYNETSTTTPGHFQTFIKPGTDVMLKFYHNGEVDPHSPGVWDVASVVATADTKQAQSIPLHADARPLRSDLDPVAPTALPVQANTQGSPPQPPQPYDQWRKQSSE